MSMFVRYEEEGQYFPSSSSPSRSKQNAAAAATSARTPRVCRRAGKVTRGWGAICSGRETFEPGPNRCEADGSPGRDAFSLNRTGAEESGYTLINKQLSSRREESYSERGAIRAD